LLTFTKSFRTPDPIPEAGIQQAVRLMQRGRLYRYNFTGDLSDDQGARTLSVEDDRLATNVAMLEHEFALYTKHRYVIAVNSCGSAIFLALKALKVQHGDEVLTNAFTFTAVPSAIVHAGGVPVYVECNSKYVIDLEDLEHKLKDHPGATSLVLSHIRGHVADLDAVKSICERAGIRLIEDCAHSLGAKWKGRLVGHHGVLACFSTQSYKVLNSGEGGLVATDDDELAAYCILAAGSYEKLYQKHLARPFDDGLFERLKPHVPNFSLRMSNLTAAVLRPQVDTLEDKICRGRQSYERLAEILGSARNIYIPSPSRHLQRAPDSLQFNLLGLTPEQVDRFAQETGERGVEIQIFGRADNARFYKNWRYSFAEQPRLEKTDSIISSACDLRLPSSFDLADLDLIGYIIKDVLYRILSEHNRQDYPGGLTDHFENVEEVRSKYDKWASFYDREHHNNGWTILLNHVAYTLRSHLKKHDLILDVGCGTGLLGRELSSYGLKNLQGLDASQRSLDLLGGLGVYSALHREELGSALSFADESFNALVSTGVFTRNQVPLKAFEELIRILKPGGIFAVVLRVEDDGWYSRPIEHYGAMKVWQEVSKERINVLKSCSHELSILRKLSTP
jgi:dTDP-4-amino-4,6-dideoxygalactose transaminase/ubiquinone/menaquinone biosynthesis C-methylase UbiE